MDYNLRFSIPGYKGFGNLEFIDIPGSFYGLTCRKEYSDAIKSFIDDASVLVVIVNVPLLMSESIIPKEANSVPSINHYLRFCRDDNKMVIFVPIKCEYWVKNDKMNEVIEKMKSVYESTFSLLKSIPNIDICILPIQTLGNISYLEHTDPYVLIKSDGTKTKCAKLDESIVRLYNGEIHTVNDDEIVAPLAYSMCLPYVWYEMDVEPPYNNVIVPHNCDQLILHILRFLYKKSMASILRFPLFFPKPIMHYLNSLGNHLAQMENNGILKDDVENITYVKRNLI